MRLKRFTKAAFLKEIGRELLGRFFAPFAGALTERKIELPAASLEDDKYFEGLSRVAMAPEGLPDDMIEALYAIEEMATEEGQERLERAVSQGELELNFDEKSSRGDIAVQAWLASPEVLAEKSNEMRLARLSSFDFYGCKNPVDRGGAYAGPSTQEIGFITGDLNDWCRTNNRGEQTVSVSVYPIDGEFWVLIRHGDTFARMPKVEKGKLQMLHFRPAKDDVVVYSPERDEVRIHAGTKGERELYQRTFGQRLFGDPDHFSERKAFTLEPLRSIGSGSLEVDGNGDIVQIVCVEYELWWGGQYNRVTILKEDDIFESAEQREKPAVPDGGQIVRAAFLVYFKGDKKPRRVQVRPPNSLRLGRYCDAAAIHRWLSENGFRETAKSGVGVVPFALPVLTTPSRVVVPMTATEVEGLTAVSAVSASTAPRPSAKTGEGASAAE